MDTYSFRAKAWNNGDWRGTGAGYGLKISVEDRDRHFRRDWETVSLRLVGDRTSRVAEANVAKASFWGPQCRELIKREIGQWLIENGFRRWPRDAPPRFRMSPAAGNKFEVRLDRD